MAGRPIRRARMQLREYERQTALREGDEPMLLHDTGLGYSTITAPPPVRHVPITPELVEQYASPAPLLPPARVHNVEMPPARPASSRPAAAPPLTDEDARIFAAARTIAIQKSLDFLKRDLSAEYDPALRAKLELKQLEIAQAMLALGGRIDPGSLRGQGSDEIGDMLAEIKSRQP